MSSPCVYELSPPMIGEVTAHGMLSLHGTQPMGSDVYHGPLVNRGRSGEGGLEVSDVPRDDRTGVAAVRGGKRIVLGLQP